VHGKAAAGLEEWRQFGAEVLGGNYNNHHPEGPVTTVKAAPDAGRHPILEGVKAPFDSRGSLYKNAPLRASATALLLGTIPGQDPEPVAWVNTYKHARVFYTSLGHRQDFENPAFVRLMRNATLWALNRAEKLKSVR
jgi:type 1 glutamine amidotransferase